jgi:hypothetical protein
MAQFTVTVSDAELKALEWDIVNVQEWVQNAISEKARRVTDRLIERHTAYNPKKLSKSQKEAEIGKIELKTAAERKLEFENSEK